MFCFRIESTVNKLSSLKANRVLFRIEFPEIRILFFQRNFKVLPEKEIRKKIINSLNIRYSVVQFLEI